MTIHQKIGAQIKAARVQTGMTQKEMGNALGRSGAAIAYLEQGKRKVGPDILQKISEVTQKPLSFFYEEEISVDTQLKEQLSALKVQLDQIRAVLDQEEKKRYRVEQQLFESEQKFRSLFECAADAMVLMDVEGKIMDFNQSYCDLLGMDRSEILGHFFWEIPFVPDDQMPFFKKAFFDAVKRGEALSATRHPFLNAQKQLIEVETTSRFLKKDTEPWAMLCSLRVQGLSKNLFSAEE